nr:hypothetical protein Iba_chr03bCG18010 [Ipomoea batatas]GMC75983.1 hypothetical protein Iba_chr03dCG9970 [Ipomoea batatas]GMC77441.1 hypothetical protein Iba_chr03eCG10730 [Ipomoea batatas]GMC78086.1 hypothetical protein Iba_chr03fCG4670 [Ipomoea batatas]
MILVQIHIFMLHINPHFYYFTFRGVLTFLRSSNKLLLNPSRRQTCFQDFICLINVGVTNILHQFGCHVCAIGLEIQKIHKIFPWTSPPNPRNTWNLNSRTSK